MKGANHCNRLRIHAQTVDIATSEQEEVVQKTQRQLFRFQTQALSKS